MTFSTIQIKYSVSTEVPSSLEIGELAYSEASKTLWIGYDDGSVREIGGEKFITALGSVEAAVEAIQTSLGSTGSIAQSIQELTDRIDGIDTQLASLATSANLQAVSDSVTELSSRVDSVEQNAANALATETGLREAADTALGDRIEAARTEASGALSSAVTSLESQITAASDALAAETAAREAADTALTNKDAQIEQSIQTNVDTLNTRINSVESQAASNLQAAIDAEKAAREAADTGLQSGIDSAKVDLQAAIDAEVAARGAADTALGQRIDSLDSNFNGTGDVTFSKVTVTGDLIVQGTTTTVNSETISLKDPVITLGDTDATVADELDRGVEYKYVDSGVSKSGFFGVDTIDNKFKFIPEASVNGNKFDGAVGTMVANVEGNADTATKLASKVEISIQCSDFAPGSAADFDGKDHLQIPVTINGESEATADKLVRRDANGGAKFAELEASAIVAAQKSTFKGGIDGVKDDGKFSQVTGMIISGGTF